MGTDFKNLLNPTIFLSVALMAIIAMMILPVPYWILDIGLAISFALAILMFTITLFIERPLDFSAFPTILLASLMLRLSLNISSTKLIIGQGHTGTNAAGNVIAGFAQFVMGGSVFLGIVVFGVLLIVNFMVITKGATRMAEVGARFALDAMPGKQLAIDSDMSAGAIDHQQAKERREREQQETTFFGSLDGASKFVKGDAVAGLLITLLNLIAGLTMGVFVHGMPAGSAFETYAILTVGDGLVSQIPAVIISIASALLLARGGAKGAVDLAVFSQLGKHPMALGTVALLMGLFALVPGLPFIPFMLGSVGLSMAAHKRKQYLDALPSIVTSEVIPSIVERTMGDILEIDDIQVEFAPNLINMVLDSGTGLDARIINMRTHIASTYGIILPEIRLTDNPSLPAGTYILKIQGVEQAKSKILPDRILALTSSGHEQFTGSVTTIEPVYGAPAEWIHTKDQDKAALNGITTILPTEILATHLLETVKQNFSLVLTLKSLRRTLQEMTRISDPQRAQENKKLLEELIPEKVPIDILQSTLKLLLDELVSIRNLPLILEAIAEARGKNATPETICEHVRQRLGFQLVADLKRDDGTIPLVQLAPDWEETFVSYQIDTDQGLNVALPPNLFNLLAENIALKLDQVNEDGIYPAIITSTRRRRFLRTILKAKGIQNPVLSFEEIGNDVRPSLVGVIAS